MSAKKYATQEEKQHAQYERRLFGGSLAISDF